MPWSVFLVAGNFQVGISTTLREASKSSRHLAISGLFQDPDIDSWYYSNSICHRSRSSHPSHLGFIHHWLVPVWKVVFYNYRVGPQYKRHESAYLLFIRYKWLKWRSRVAYIVMMSIVGVVFGGIHCIGWFFNFPSSVEAMLWRVSSAVLTGIAFLLPLLLFLASLADNLSDHDFVIPLFISFTTIIILVYVISRLLLLVEAFISLRHLTPGMLALVKWTSFIPHIWSYLYLFVRRISSYNFDHHFDTNYLCVYTLVVR